MTKSSPCKTPAMQKKVQKKKSSFHVSLKLVKIPHNAQVPRSIKDLITIDWLGKYKIWECVESKLSLNVKWNGPSHFIFCALLLIDSMTNRLIATTNYREATWGEGQRGRAYQTMDWRRIYYIYIYQLKYNIWLRKNEQKNYKTIVLFFSFKLLRIQGHQTIWSKKLMLVVLLFP